MFHQPEVSKNYNDLLLLVMYTTIHPSIVQVDFFVLKKFSSVIVLEGVQDSMDTSLRCP